MATDLKDKQTIPDADANDPYNREFAALTDSEHYNQDGTPGKYGEGGRSSFYNPNGDSKTSSPSEIAAQEKEVSAPATSQPAEGGGLYTGEERSRSFGRFRFTRRRGIIGTAIGLTLGGGVFFGGSILSGPFQFIHMAQLMQQFHLNQQSNDANTRIGKLTRYARYAKQGKLQNTRLGFFGNHFADTVENKMKAAGITPEYAKDGTFKGYSIDPKELGQGDTNATKQYYKDTYGISLAQDPNDNTKLFASSSDLIGPKGYLADSSLIASSMKEAGYGGITGSVMKRIVGKRAGLTLHPIRRADSKLLSSIKSLYAQMKSSRDTSIAEGAPDERATITRGKDDPNNPTDPAQQQDATNAEQAASDTQQLADEGNTSGLKDSLGKTAKVGGAGAFGLGVACMLRSVDKNATKYKETRTVLPLMRMGFEMVSLGNQVMDGSDFDIAQLGFYSQFMSGGTAGPSGGPTSWAAARSIQAELGEKMTGPTVDKTLTTIGSGTPLSFIENVPGLGTACGQIVQDTLNVLSFVAGPISFAFSQIISDGITQTLQQTGALTWVMQMVAGKSLDPNSFVGASFGDAVNYGTTLAGNDSFIAAGGAKLSPTEVAQNNATVQTDAMNQFHRQSFIARVFNPYTPYSLVGTILDKQNPNISANISQAMADILVVPHLFSSMAGAFGSLFTGHAQAAAAPYDYGFPIYGFSQSDMSSSEVENPYTNASNVIDMLQGSNGQNIISAAQKCFNVAIAPDGSSVNAIGAIGSSAVDTFDPSYNSDDCADGKAAGLSQPDWLRVRMFIFDSETADSMSCYQGDAQSCANVGFDSTGSSQQTVTGSPVAATGPASQIAGQLLELWGGNLTGNPGVKDDLTATSQGKTINNSDTCGNTITLNPNLLQVLLTATSKYKLFLDNIVTGHGCDQFLHPKGRASDIGNVTDLATGKSTNFTPGTSGDNQQLDHDFYVYLASILPKGGEMGQSECAGRTDITPPPGITFFPDTCTHQHVDVGDQ